MAFETKDWIAVGAFLTSSATLALSYSTFRWTKRQSHVEVFELVPHWKLSTEEFGRNPILYCHNRSSKSIFVTKVSFLTVGIFFKSAPWDATKASLTFDTVPRQIRPDSVEEFEICVSHAIDGLKNVTSLRSLGRILNNSRLFVQLTTATGAVRSIEGGVVVPLDVQSTYRLGKLCRPYAQT